MSVPDDVKATLCRVCAGAGFIETMYFGKTYQELCLLCNGSGAIVLPRERFSILKWLKDRWLWMKWFSLLVLLCGVGWTWTILLFCLR